MSLSSVAASAARAQANAPAKKGDVVLVPHIRSATALNGPTTRTQSYSLGMVTSVTRDGMVKAYAYFVDYAAPRYWHGLNTKPTSGHIAGCIVASASRFAKPVRDILESIPQEFPSIDAAKEALRPFVQA